ncbi:endonuclease VII domain-containing protein [Curtobacterium sp. UCD-KPL2560]|uniref:endonuclease VII domain-containing protein n=1 Tax=Curtobacterium sp. UCD-KPL2560 TaxID=1885315 RepID=UPI0009F20D21|nr:endonuclease VII domain-containing protein [Curtobacterium sp. UCD-KPL2560]
MRIGPAAVDGSRHPLSEVDLTARTATCGTCGFTAIKVKKGTRGICREVVRQEKERLRRARGVPPRRPAAVDASHRSEQRKISRNPEARAAFIEDHGGACAICGSTNDLRVDHDHKTGAVRGLLCSPCNVGIGWLQDDVALLRQAIGYLSGH